MTEVVRRGSVYYVRFSDGSKAYLAFEIEGNVMKLLETYTPPRYRGKGYAKLLVERAIRDAKAQGLKVYPVCSYAVYYFIKNPSERDVLVSPLSGMSDEELVKLFKERIKEERQRKA